MFWQARDDRRFLDSHWQSATPPSPLRAIFARALNQSATLWSWIGRIEALIAGYFLMLQYVGMESEVNQVARKTRNSLATETNVMDRPALSRLTGV